jgi:hypothetical protein
MLSLSAKHKKIEDKEIKSEKKEACEAKKTKKG